MEWLILTDGIAGMHWMARREGTDWIDGIDGRAGMVGWDGSDG